MDLMVFSTWEAKTRLQVQGQSEFYITSFRHPGQNEVMFPTTTLKDKKGKK